MGDSAPVVIGRPSAPVTAAGGEAAVPSSGSLPARRSAAIDYIPGLDGLRAVAVIAVFLFHGGVGAASGGYLAVSTFFTLSGFLITLLLCAELRSHGDVSVASFWDRRVRRLLPAAALGVALAAVVTALVGGANARQRFGFDAAATFFDVANWRFVLAEQSYGQLFEAPSALQHAWSLAIEAQFYWIYPLLFVGLMRLVAGDRRRFGVVLGALFAGSLALTAWGGFDADRIYYGTDTRAAELLAGAILGLAVASRPGGRLSSVRGGAPSTVGVVSVVAFAVLVVAWVVTPAGASWLGAGGLGLYAVVSCLVIVGASTPGTAVGRALGVRPLRSLGRISYGVYLFHWPILLLLSPDRVPGPEIVRLALAAGLTLALATVSYRAVERPVRTRSGPYRRLGLAPIVGGCAVVALLPTLVVVWGAPAPSTRSALDPGALVSDTERLGRSDGGDVVGTAAGPAASRRSPDAGDGGGLAPRRFTMPSRPLRVVVVGDSMASELAPLLDRWDDRDDGDEVWNVAAHARPGCGILRGGYTSGTFGDIPFAAECGAWVDEWPRMLDDVEPDLVVVAGGLWDAVDRRSSADEPWRGPGDPVHDRRLRDDYDLALDVLTGTGVPVVWLDHPPLDADALETSLAGPQGYTPERMQRLDEIQADLAAGRPTVRIVRTMDFLVAWPGGVLDDALRPDGVHFRGEGAAPFADWLAPELLHAYWSVADGADAP